MPTTGSFHVELQDRDIALLKGLFESRLMTIAQAAAIHFNGGTEAAKKRIQKLKAAGYLAERPRRAYDPSILFLTKKSFATLAEGGYLNDYPPLIWTDLEKRARVSELTLKHELAVMDFKAAVHTAVATCAKLRIAEFTTWPLLYEFHASPNEGRKTMTVRPDGFVRLHEAESDGSSSEHTFFLELDRSTEVLDTLITRTLCYRDYYRRGGLAARHGRPHKEFEQFPFRVLIVVRNTERRNNLCERLVSLRPAILSQIWLTTFQEGIADPLGAIWVTPYLYRTAVAGSPFASFQQDPAIYRRSIEREIYVEGRVEKQSLLCFPTESMAPPLDNSDKRLDPSSASGMLASGL
jgi:hypothetical protein